MLRVVIAPALFIAMHSAFAQPLSASEEKQIKEEVRHLMMDVSEQLLPQSESTLTPEGTSAARKCIANGMTNILMGRLASDRDPRGAIQRFRSDPSSMLSNLSDASELKQEIPNCLTTSAAANAREVSDVLVDYDELSGKRERVWVKGFFMPVGELNYLYERAGTMPFLMVDTTLLSREERKKLLKGCGRGCTTAFFGVPQNVMFNKGIVANISVIARK